LLTWADGCCVFTCRLGHGNRASVDVPKKVEGLLNDDGTEMRVHSIVCGATHTAIVSDEGRVLCCGSGSSFELGNESTTPQARFVVVRTALGEVPCRSVALATGATLALSGVPVPHRSDVADQKEKKARAALEEKKEKEKDKRVFTVGGALERAEFNFTNNSPAIKARDAAFVMLAHIGALQLPCVRCAASLVCSSCCFIRSPGLGADVQADCGCRHRRWRPRPAE
jgi:hypothetical protein